MAKIYGNPITLGGGGGQNADLPPLLDNFKAYAGTTPPEPETITLADIPVSDAETETIVNLKESDGKLHPYLYLSNNHNNTNGALLLRKNISVVKGVWVGWAHPDDSRYYRYWCENEFLTTILDSSVSSQVIEGNIKAAFTQDSGSSSLGSATCFALSLHEYGLKIGDSYIKDEGPQLPYFSTNQRRIAYNDAGSIVEHYTRTSVTATGFYIDTNGTNQSDYDPMSTPRGLRPAIFLPFSFKLIATANEDGSYDMYEEQAVQTLAEADGIITIAADKMEESRANELAGAVWVYGDHIPKNINDGTKIQLAREEIVRADGEPYISLNDIPVSDAETETIVNLKENDGQLHPYIYLSNDYEGSRSGLLLRKKCYQKGQFSTGGTTNFANFTYDKWCNETFINFLDESVKSKLVEINVKVKNAVSGSSVGVIVRKCFPLSDKEYGGSSSAPEGTAIPYFSTNERRLSVFESSSVDYWTRSATMSGIGQAHFIGLQGLFGTDSVTLSLGYRPAFCLPLNFKLKSNPNLDGSYDMYEEAVSMNALSTQSSISSVSSKSIVELGEYDNKPLTWILCRDKNDLPYLTLSTESITNIGDMPLDAAEPTNPNSDRKQYGNNRCIYLNIQQWLNSTGTANSWFSASYAYDAPPSYQNRNAFLYGWSKEHLDVVENNTWTTTKSSIDGGGTETFQSKFTLLSTSEVGLEENGCGDCFDIFTDNSSRDVGKFYFSRNPVETSAYEMKGVHTGGGINQTAVINSFAIRPVCKINPNTIVELTSEGTYKVTGLSLKITKSVAWKSNKDFYARQFTYNSKKQYQTMLEGALAKYIYQEGQGIQNLSSGSKISFGKFNDKKLHWILDKESDSENILLVLNSDSVIDIGNMMWDNAEPSNTDSGRKEQGNNRYIYSNIHQWLNSDKSANSWYSAQHSYDNPPDYQNLGGFLNGWDEKHKGYLINKTWQTVRSNTDGGGSETFESYIVLPSTTETGLASGTGGNKINILSQRENLVIDGINWWTRTPMLSRSDFVSRITPDAVINTMVGAAAKLGVRPICAISKSVLVSLEPDENGYYDVV